MTLAAADVARALLLAAAGAEPEDEQLAALAAEIESDPGALTAIARKIFQFREKLARIERRGLADHTQFGELLLLLRELVTAGRRHGIIVDVGACGRAGSNSYDLLTDYGWTGLLIEANPALIPRIRAEFGAAHYTLVNCAVGLEPGRRTLHLGPDDQVSSLLASHISHFGAVSGGIEVDVRRLPDILNAHAVPHDFDVLSIDVEGLDEAVLNDLIATSPYRPRWIVVEVVLPWERTSLADTGLSEQVRALYEFVERTPANFVLRCRG